MRNAFYSRLALGNIRKNSSIYLPYLLSGTVMVILFYILSSVQAMVLDSTMYGGGTMAYILMASGTVCGILSLVILFYINSFVMKRRKREFGLYNILGMEKRHIAIVLFWEVGIAGAACIVGGIAFSALLSQLMFLLLCNMVGLPVGLTFQIPLGSVMRTAGLFGAGFLIVLLYDIVAIRRSEPVLLLHSDRQGEREPKSRWIAALFGVLTLGGGYFLALRVRTPSDAIAVFFPAVLLVIIGTYLLFITGSVVLLKRMRRHKTFYYRPENFISVSGMLYRMKQNAAGLANICILSTCVLVTLSSTLCLFIGEEDILRQQYPRQVHVNCVDEGDSAGLMEQAAETHAGRYGFAVENAAGYYYVNFPALLEGDGFIPQRLYAEGSYSLRFITLEDYNRLSHRNEQLANGETLAVVVGDPLPGDTLTLGGISFRVKGEAKLPEVVETNDNVFSVTVVVPALSDLQTVKKQVSAMSDRKVEIWYDYKYDVTGNPQNLPAFYASMWDAYSETVPRMGVADNIDAARSDFFQIYGSMMFVGIFFVLLFLTATVLIIYYKQITEGFEDHDRFQIMERVGMSDREVRRTIQKQVLMVFFLPLGMAIVHIAVAFPVLCKLMTGFHMTNTMLFFLCTAGTALVFIAFYFIVYQVTARTYYRIVQAK